MITGDRKMLGVSAHYTRRPGGSCGKTRRLHCVAATNTVLLQSQACSRVHRVGRVHSETMKG